MKSNRLRCEFLLVRYVPDAVKNEFVNIGVILREPGTAESAAAVRFTRDWSRVRCVDPLADIGMLEALEEELASRVLESNADPEIDSRKTILDTVADSFSNQIQVTNPKGCLAESFVAELELLMRMYVEGPPQVAKERSVQGRQAITRNMRREFERVGVWGLMRKRIAASTYTTPGDPLRLDCGYRPNGVLKIFHGVSLGSDLDTAKVMAYSMPQLIAGIRSLEGATLEMTAIVEPLRNVSTASLGDAEKVDISEQYRFGVSVMEQAGLRVLTTADLARIAERAQSELQV